MTLRHALFEGRLHPGRATELRPPLHDALSSPRRRLTGIRELRLLHEGGRDRSVPDVAMGLSTAFDDRAALASPVRGESREVARGLLALLQGQLHHPVPHLARDEAGDA